jgi:hypothetical protein
MKLFSRPLLRWNEPILFEARTRDRRGWMRRGLLALAIFAAMMAAFAAQERWGRRGPKFSLAFGVAMSAVVGLFLTSLLDAPGLNREVTIDGERISSFGNAGTVHSHQSWRLRDVARVRLYTPEEFGRPYGALDVITARGTSRLGVPARMAASRIAEVLARQGVEVVLPGWQPGQDEPASAPPTFVATPTASARVEALGEAQAGQIRTASRRNFAMALEAIPLLVPLLAFLGMIGYAGYRIAAARGPISALDLAVGLGGLVLLSGGVWFAGRFGALVPALYLRGAARSVVELRPDALFNPADPDAVFVSVVPRANWGKLMLNQVTDVGFLKVDRASRCLLFEGDTQRWRIPAQSLASVAVESYVPLGKTEGPPPREGEPHQERFYMTVIRARVGDDEWEAPVSTAAVDWRPRNNSLREANALAIRDRVRELLPSGGVVQGADPPAAG